MGDPRTNKELLQAYNHQQYAAFLLNKDKELTLPEVSSVPWIVASKRRCTYTKDSLLGLEKIKFIKKRDNAHGFVWETDAQQLKKGVRWGIISTQSVTGKVIETLGRYRITAHARICKGMLSNSQAAKLCLLDLFQDRFEALEILESLVNKNNRLADYQRAFEEYLSQLNAIKKKLNEYFTDNVFAKTGLDKNTLLDIQNDLQKDIDRAQQYLMEVSRAQNIKPYQAARGQYSILEFVKQTMQHGLYELQGISQDMTYSNQRSFALTRGELNNDIEDALHAIDMYQPDLRNAVTEKHHGNYASPKQNLVSYDYTKEHLSAEREREVLMAISFIEGWDSVGYKNNAYYVTNGAAKEPLDVITATQWKNHRTLITLFKSIGYYLARVISGMFVNTMPWSEETWTNKSFHLATARLWAHAKPKEPMWKKPLQLFKDLGHAFRDLFHGIYAVGNTLVFKLPSILIDDWEVTNELYNVENVLQRAELEIKGILEKEKKALKDILNKCNLLSVETKEPSSYLAKSEYTLSAGEQNDILTAMARGITEFSSFFTHQIYAKDPVGGLLFTAGYAVGAGAIFLPAVTAKIFGASYVNWFSSASYAMGKTKLAAAVAGGSTQGQVFSSIWETFIHGPSGMTLNALYEAGENPLMVCAGFATVYGLGYILVNGSIPYISEYFKEELGSAPETAYPLIGAKIGIMLYDALHQPEKEAAYNLACSFIEPLQQREKLLQFLAEHAEHLAQLPRATQLNLSQALDSLCSKEESASLKKWLCPESPPSIAFQIFAVPLYYVPATVRLVLGVFLSMVALLQHKAHPWAPLKRAVEDLKAHLTKDLSRLAVFATYLVYLPYSLLASLVKIVVYPINMLLGRIAGLFGMRTGHASHQFFASVHGFMRRVGELLYPVRALKSVAIAHPVHTIKECEMSYIRLVKSLEVKTNEGLLPVYVQENTTTKKDVKHHRGTVHQHSHMPSEQLQQSPVMAV